jgi:DNA-directed RNA polymerase subunit RPC12/RpoP
MHRLASHREYLWHLRCPGCGSKQRQSAADFEVVDDRTLSQDVRCLDCGARWIDVFQLTCYAGFLPPEVPHE